MKKKNKYAVPSFLENLEQRTLFAAVSLNAGVMNLGGSLNQTNKLAITTDSSGRIWGVTDNYSSSYSPSQVSAINLTEGGTNDSYNIAANIPVPVRIYSSTGTLLQTIPAGSAAVSNTNTGGSSQTTQTTNPSAPVAVITTDSATSLLPTQSVFVDGLASTLNSGTYLTTDYQWNFGDTGSNDNTLVGFNAGHAYENPGTYTVTLTVTNSLGLSSTTTQQVIVSPDNRPTIYVDAVKGSDSNNGSSPSQAIQSLAKLNQIIQPNEIILFARGETFGATSGTNLQPDDTVDAYGSGASPVLQWQLSPVPEGACIFLAPAATAQNDVIQNLTFDTLNPNTNATMPDAIVVGGADITVRDNTFLNIADCVNANESPDGLLMEGNQQPLLLGMQGYMLWFQGENGVIVSNTSVNSTRQHNIRASTGFSNLLIENNNLANPANAGGDPLDEVDKDVINMQYGSFIYIADNTVTGGPLRLGPLDANELDANPTTALLERETWTVVEDNTVNQTDIEVHPGTVNAVVRNNVVNFDNSAGIMIYGYDSTYKNIVQNVSFLNNTVINTGDMGQAFYVTGQTSQITIANNLYIAPNLEPGYWGTASPLYINYSDLSGFTSISNNIWPNPATITGWGNGGVNYLAPGANTWAGFITETAWNQMAPVSNDIFSTIQLNAGNQDTVNGVTAGANLSVNG